MLYWQILLDTNDKNTLLSTFDVCGKTYLEQLIWYYAKYSKKMGVKLVQPNQQLAEKLTQQCAHLGIDSKPDSTMSTLILDARYAITGIKRILNDVQVVEDSEVSRIYYYKNEVVAIMLTAELRQKINDQDKDAANNTASLGELEQLLTRIAPTSAVVKLKKKHVIRIKEPEDIQRFMALLNRVKQRQLMRDGVFIIDKKSTWIDPDVAVGSGTVVLPATLLRGATSIGQNCQIGPAARIIDSKIGEAVTVKDSTVMSSSIDDQTTVGPYAYLRPKSDIGKNVKIGDFVEVKNSRIDDGSKVSHLSYIGDGFIGKNVNVGCGAVFVNYDGYNKHKTVVEDNCFVGCNANLVAPVTVKTGAFVAAGSTITNDVVSDSLAIARARQSVKQDWAKMWAKLNKK